ncbi:hypothetical protein BZG01_14580 [Labilibaculum manganireducens]|uniref:Reverse transcriptase domain-containing protein n=1 Tax=Labilibaculum manganireducens TaxID=1940525 RepID=A0A2N3I2R8_9BACT|nr:reverse transcriptase domain-containing protein [Labilibaculum manganireducens]PKQ64601.1 hypothetical protein BZG01_14580 [Labilibaculum manganireducens]
MEHQQAIVYQRDLFIGQNGNAVRQSENCEDVNGSKTGQAGQFNKSGQQGRALTAELMTIVCSSHNLKQAYKRVNRNKGVAGIDQMPTGKFADWFITESESMINDLQQGNYQPQGVKQAEIPKPKGGMRNLGIPTVMDRIIQQAIAQVLIPIYEREFSEKSNGYRPGRNAQQALRQASEYVTEGREEVVDMKSFFDEVNHDRLMYELSTKIVTIVMFYQLDISTTFNKSIICLNIG